MENKKINLIRLILTSVFGGFFLLPVHELGHVICHWLSGTPAGMSYAMDYLLKGGEKTFLGYLGGPLLPLLISAICVILIYIGKGNLSVLYPIAVIGAFDRMILYIQGDFPSDERMMAGILHWNDHAFIYIFLSFEIVLYLLIIISLFRYKIKWIMKILCIVIPVAAFIGMALFGIYVVEKNIFPQQFKQQF